MVNVSSRTNITKLKLLSAVLSEHSLILPFTTMCNVYNKMPFFSILLLVVGLIASQASAQVRCRFNATAPATETYYTCTELAGRHRITIDQLNLWWVQGLQVRRQRLWRLLQQLRVLWQQYSTLQHWLPKQLWNLFCREWKWKRRGFQDIS